MWASEYSGGVSGGLSPSRRHVPATDKTSEQVFFQARCDRSRVEQFFYYMSKTEKLHTDGQRRAYSMITPYATRNWHKNMPVPYYWYLWKHTYSEQKQAISWGQLRILLHTGLATMSASNSHPLLTTRGQQVPVNLDAESLSIHTRFPLIQCKQSDGVAIFCLVT